MEETTASFRKLLEESRGKHGDNKLLDVFSGHIREDSLVATAEQICGRRKFRLSKWGYAAVFVAVVTVAIPLLLPELCEDFVMMMKNSECLVDNNLLVMEMSRPVFDCNICKNVKEVPIEYGMTKETFAEKYAYSDIPVLVKQATGNWTAMDTFSLFYFRKIYHDAEKKQRIKNRVEKKLQERQQFEDEEIVEEDGLACQFFPYKTEFESLMEALDMNDDRAIYKKGQKPWYFGWSNCNDEVQEELRKHYNRPHFLPDDSETSALDWIFMGGRGHGAPMHLDSVSRPSWQAQISGRKTWSLDPPPECLSECNSFNVTVEQGDIFVINTNVWYHGTFVHKGDVSICIGSEYD